VITENLKTEIDTVKSSAKKSLPTWVRWIPAFALVAILYFASVAPVMQLVQNHTLSNNALLIYKPLISIHSPLYQLTFDYLMEYPS